MNRLIAFLRKLVYRRQPLTGFEPNDTNWSALRTAAKTWRLEADKTRGDK